jgi:hypothetical protein
MTRINVGIHPSELPDKLLLAEHREIKRIPNVIKSGRYSLEGIPDQFTLGKGHVKFFYNKLWYLYSRYRYLYIECKERGFNVQDYSNCWSLLSEPNFRHLGKGYTPTGRDRQLLIERITSKGFSLLSKD